MSQVICLLLIFTLPVLGQTGKAAQSKTKIEAFQARTGTVVVKGFTTAGRVQGQYGGQVEVESMEFNDAISGSTLFGVKIDVAKGDTLETHNSSFVDADEIDSLLKGIDYISKIDGSVTKMKQFQADYRTKDDLTISTYNDSKGDIGTAITSGEIGPARVFLSREGLTQFRAVIVEAKAEIDAAR